jgi:hypothetical protein
MEAIRSPDMFRSLCDNKELATYISRDPESVPPIASDLEKVICVNPEVMLQSLQEPNQAAQLQQQVGWCK